MEKAGDIVLTVQLSDKSKRRMHVKADRTCNGNFDNFFPSHFPESGSEAHFSLP